MRLLTTEDIAKRLQFDEATIRDLLRKGELRGFKISGEWRVSEEDLASFLEKHANVPRESQ
ncbi:helix-turn-helix domain-containing protein [Laceyella putida]|uniref:Helix-turn-helix domain-containing protein n=1 Tax=Laceyella putida TaxID=110101 RepID=A0ABW2RS16_9BACL